jgi:5-methylthioadenosine/S-adenosylhomocysteine deaminase
MNPPSRSLVHVGAAVTMDATRRILRDGAIVINGGTIERVLTADELQKSAPFDGEIVNARRLTAIPGFIQTHVHLCQTLFRGMAEDLDLLNWLSRRIYPLEAAHTPASMRAAALAGVAELQRSGTTTIMDMGSIRFEEEIVSVVEETGMRAFVGKALMDLNESYPGLREATTDACTSARRQAEQWHGSGGGRIRYAVSPRFVLSCSDALLREVYAMTADFPGMLFHTHAAESVLELESVRSRCGMRNIEYLDHLHILHPNTCLAHCIWLSDREIGLLSDRESGVLHCPSSNLKLASGIARIPQLLAEGVKVSLGSDGAACNNGLDMFREMRLAALIQKPVLGAAAMPASLVFELATRGGAEALGLASETGSIEAGKRADLTLIDLERCLNTGSEDIYSTLVYACGPDDVHSVMIDGSWVYRDRIHLRLDQQRVTEQAIAERDKLLQRVQW